MSSLTPGLYKATVRGVPDQTVFIDGAGIGRTADYVQDHREHVAKMIDSARQMIVLDLDEPQWHKFVVEVLREARHSWTNDVADQIEAQTKPPRIPEPGLWGVVEASTADWGRRVFIRDTLGALHSWITPYFWPGDSKVTRAVAWVDLVDPVLVRDGIEDPS